MDVSTMDILRSIAMDILLFGGAIAIIVLLVLLILILRGVIKTTKMISNINQTFMQLRAGAEKLLDPLLMFVNMLRLSMQDASKKPKKATSKKPSASKAVAKKKSTTAKKTKKQ